MNPGADRPVQNSWERVKVCECMSRWMNEWVKRERPSSEAELRPGNVTKGRLEAFLLINLKDKTI